MKFANWGAVHTAAALTVTSLAILWILSSNGPEYWQSVAASLILVYYLGRLFAVAPVALFATLPLIASFGGVVASCLYIEAGHYISEEGRYGSLTGGTIRLSFMIAVLVSGAMVGLHAFSRFATPFQVPAPKQIERFSKWSFRLHAASIVACLAIMAVYGVPLLRGQDRFSYWNSLPGGLSHVTALVTVATLLSTISVVAELSIGSNRIRVMHRFTVLAFCSATCFILLSDKFTSLSQTIIFGVAAAQCARVYYLNIRPRFSRVFIGGLMALATLLVVAAYGYIILYGYTAQNVVQTVEGRALGLQGHVWFRTDFNFQWSGTRGTLNGMFGKNSFAHPTGLDELMYQVAPPNFVDAMRSKGLRFTAGGPALAVYTFGYAGAAIYQFFSGLYTALAATLLVAGIRSLSFVRVIVAFMGFRVVIESFFMGDGSALYSWMALTFYVCILIDGFGNLFRHRARPPQKLSGAPGGAEEVGKIRHFSELDKTAPRRKAVRT